MPCATPVTIGCFVQNLRTLIKEVTSFVASLDHDFRGNAICRRTLRDAIRVTDGAATELQHYVFSEIVQ